MTLFLAKTAGRAAVSSLLLLVPPTAPAVPSPGVLSTLSGVGCTSASNCWAVGHYVTAAGAVLNEALKWNGHSWAKTALPNPGGTGANVVNSLLAVACASSTDCWAVGYTSTASGGERSEALHWTGRKWSRVSTPAPPGATTKSNRLLGVSCTSANNCWAVGESVSGTAPTAPTLNQALHWIGRKWVVARIPDPGGSHASAFNELTGISCTSAWNCWAVGRASMGNSLNNAPMLNQALHWNGRTWAAFSTPNPGGTGLSDFSELAGVSCPSRQACWAVGNYGNLENQSSLGQALRWNGKKWATAKVPNPDAENFLAAVACSTAVRCWAAGSSGARGVRGIGIFANTLLLLSRGTWSRVLSPNPGGTSLGDTNSLAAVTCASATFCWAVGYVLAIAQSSQNEALRWDGSKWIAG